MLSNRMLTHVATVSRHQKIGRVIGVQEYKTNVRGSLQPMANKAALEYSLIPGKAYAFYTNERDFNVTDVLSVNGKSFVVRGVNDFDNFGDASHVMLLLDQAA